MKSYNQQTKNHKKCVGCGLVLTIEPHQPGYTAKPIIHSQYCQACYQLINYQTPPSNPLNSIDYFQLQQANLKKTATGFSSKTLTVLITDVYNLSVLNHFEKFLINPQFCVIINKIDHLVYHQKTWLKNLWAQKLKSLNYQVPIFLVSVKKNLGFNVLIDYLKKFHKFYFTGDSGSGKSSIIQHLAQKFNFSVPNLVSHYLNTTKNSIVHKIAKQKYVDTPGAKREHGLFHLLDYQAIKTLQNQTWKPRIFQLKNSRIFRIENYCQINLQFEQTNSSKNSFVFYGPESLQISHHKYVFVQPIWEHFQTNFKSFALQNLGWKIRSFLIRHKTILVIEDLGWITINVQQPIHVQVYLPNTINFEYYQEEK